MRDDPKYDGNGLVPAVVQDATTGAVLMVAWMNAEALRADQQLVRQIVEASPLPVEVGGGIRDRAAIDSVLAAGAQLVVLGTAAVKTPALVEDACKAHPGRVIVAVDAKDGVVAVDGWTTSGGITAIELGRRAASWGAAALLYTDVARDGLRQGPNVEAGDDPTREHGPPPPLPRR